MKLGARIFFCYLLIFIVCFYYPFDWMLDNLRIRYLEGVEDPLVDQANILAGIVGRDMERGQFDPDDFYDVFADVYARPLSSRIYELMKTNVDIDIYITDTSGTVLFDSRDKSRIGADYSRWRDVKLTLAGRYGARTTRKYERVLDSSVLYVAAPVYVNDRLAGVLTVAKPTTNINNFLKGAKPQISTKGTISLLAAVMLSLLASIWITRPIKRLTWYTDNIREGKRVPFPKLDRSEIGELGNALSRMQDALEGKKYAEQYVQSLTHEIKSPLSAIRGAAELLEEKMRPEQRARFLSNIRSEANRIRNIVDRMLELSTLENQKMLRRVEAVYLRSVIKTVIESKRPMLLKKHIAVKFAGNGELIVEGDSFLLHQAIGNIVQNAIDFSPLRGRISITARQSGRALALTIDDDGPGVPDYAGEKVFAKFFSLQRPDTGKKSTGLGLNFVQEVAILHNGTVRLTNRPDKGTRATLTLACSGQRSS